MPSTEEQTFDSARRHADTSSPISFNSRPSSQSSNNSNKKHFDKMFMPKGDNHHRPLSRGTKGLKRRLSESARDLSTESFSRLSRFGSGLKRKLSNSARDLLSVRLTPSSDRPHIRKEDITVINQSHNVDREAINQSKNNVNSCLEKLPFPECETAMPIYCSAKGINIAILEQLEANESRPLHKQISTSMKDLFTSTKTPQDKRKGTGKKISRQLSFLTEAMLGKSDKINDSQKFPRMKRSRIVEVEVLQPDGSRTYIRGVDSQSVRELVTPLSQSLKIFSFSLSLEDSMAEVDLDAPAALLDGDRIVLNDLYLQDDFGGDTCLRLRLTKDFLSQEKEFATRLAGIENLYGRPLRKLSSITAEEHQQIFGGVEAVLKISKEICVKLTQILSYCDKEADQIDFGSIFNEELWEPYEFYLNHRPTARMTLYEKELQDDEFVDFCKLRRGAAKHSLIQLLNLPAERLSEYEQYFASLLVDTHPDHPDHADLSKNHERLGQLVTRHDDDFGELERIQDLFPNDNLKLYEGDPVSQKMKGLIRKRSTTAARLQRAFSAKGLRAADGQSQYNNNNNNNNNKDSPYNNNLNSNESNSNGGLSPNKTKDGKPKRLFIMETPVQFTTGVQSQERHLFLFSDLLLVAKARSGGNFKLKEKVRVSEMWLSNCLDDVSEVTKSSDTSFVMGWPTTNVVASFSCMATKDLWYNKLSQVVSEERDKEPPSTTIQVTYYDLLNNTDICKTVSISSTTTARECVSLVLAHLEMPVHEERKFQLWVKSPSEEAPYPLIGHEFPFAVRMNCLRDLLQECDAEQCGNLYNTDVMGRCQFILRQERKQIPQTGILESNEGGKKVSKKARKSPIRIHKVFKRSNSKGDVTDGSAQNSAGGVLFAQPLNKICDAEGALPKPIMDLLHQLLQKGPFTVGIFRKSANARLVRELKEKLDSGEEVVDLNTVHITAIAALFKDFLRSLPDCLLCADLYEEWLELPRLPTARERVSRTLLLCSRLPRPHLNLLQLFLCVLHHIARRAAENMMSASNLAVCVGPSILWPSSPILALSPEASKQAPATVEFLIDRCCSVFGKDILKILGDPPEQDPLRQDSGAEESDSLHSLHSGHSMHSSGGMRRDDSSIDSLERELIGEGELSPLPRKDKMSLTNLSRDSGLTMSDSQLYTPDEEESGSTSSSHSGGEKNYNSNQHERTNERFQHYAAPNNPNAIYTAIYRRPEKVQPLSCDEPDSYYAAPNREHTRVHITYSTPNYNPGNYGTQSPHKEYNRVYQERHNPIAGTYPVEEEEAIYSVPGGAAQHLLPFVASSNFQRHDWMRRCSNLRKVSKTNSGEGGLMRSTSEESLLNKYNALEYGVSLGAAGSAGNQTECFNKGRALPPTPTEYEELVREPVSLGGRESPLRRSRSAHQIIDANEKRLVQSPDHTPDASRSAARENARWHRSRSTPQIHEEGDRSYDSSTLSDDDSTPHVSRSNSRGKECGNGSLQAWDSSDSHNSRNSSFKSERTGSMCTVVSAGSTSTLSSNPPSYEEALNRRSLMHNKAQQSGHNCGNGISDYAIREEKMKSARAKQLYEESLRIYQEENAYPCDLVRASPAHAHDSDDPERPPPLPPKSEPPPLPPKQKSGRKSSEGSGRLKHLPPVHVETVGRKSRSVTSVPANQIIYDPPLHKTIIYTDDNPPMLPPKERTIIEVEANYASNIEKKSIETQTDDCDLLDDEGKDEGIQTSGSWLTDSHTSTSSMPHVTSVSVSVPDTTYREGRRRGREKHKNYSSSPRSRSVPGRESGRNRSSDCEEEEEEEWNTYSNSQDFSANTYGLKDLKQLDPDLQQEISWSVSQLRAIFGDSLKGAKVHPPPYRPPPSAHRSPITSYHLGAGENFCRKQRPHSNYGEESYV